MEYTSNLTAEVVEHMGSDQTVAMAARVSTGKEDDAGRLEGLINYLVREKHTSTLEHCVVTFKIEAPIFVAREAMRHRTFSFNEISGRYAKLEPKFYVPDTTRPLVNKGTGAHPKLVVSAQQQELHRAVDATSEAVSTYAYTLYEGLIEQGVATEVARNVLPVSIYTRWYQTANLNNWFKFLELRQAENAQWEIRQIANQVADALETLYPVTVAAWRKHRA